MRREFGLPFAAWMIAALLAHLLWTTGAERVAQLTLDRADRLALTRGEDEQGKKSDDAANPSEIEVSLEAMDPDQSALRNDIELPDPQALLKLDAQKDPDDPDNEIALPQPIDEQEAALVVVPEVPVEQVPPPPVQPDKDSRIAVEQHVEPGQEDNPNAEFIGNEANHVKEQTVARITAHDRNDKDPTPSGQHSSEEKLPGNAEETLIADSEDRPGDPDQAPGETTSDEPEQALDDSNKVAQRGNVPDEPPPEATQKPQQKPGQKRPQVAVAPLDPASDRSVETITSERGSYSLDPTRKTKPGQRVANKADTIAPTKPFGLDYGSGDSQQNRVRTNLTMNDVVATVGVDELARQRRADGQRRRSKHRGSWQGTDFNRWKASIENYVSSVRTGNQTALNTARVPFATYLVRIHNRIHPVFADTFLASLDSLPFDHAMNNYKLMTRLEIVLEPDSGRVVRMGVIKTSGITAFDVGALESVQRSSPFGQAPPAIISNDGNVYLHWEFHRNPIYACSTMNARPYMLTTPPKPSQPPPREPRPPSDPRERGAPPPAGPVHENDGSRFGKRARGTRRVG